MTVNADYGQATVLDCFEELSEEEWERWRGNAALLAQRFGCFELTMWVRVCESGAMWKFAGSTLTSEQIVQLMDETLIFLYQYFACAQIFFFFLTFFLYFLFWYLY